MISWEVCVTSTLYIFDLRFLQVFDPIRFAILEMALRRAFFKNRKSNRIKNLLNSRSKMYKVEVTGLFRCPALSVDAGCFEKNMQKN